MPNQLYCWICGFLLIENIYIMIYTLDCLKLVFPYFMPVDRNEIVSEIMKIKEEIFVKRNTYKYYLNFFLYFLSFMLIEAYVNIRIQEIFGTEYVNYIYSIGLIFTATGYVLNYFYKKTSLSSVSPLISISASASLLIYSFLDNAIIVFVFSMVCLLITGFIGGIVHEMCSDIICDEYFTVKLSFAMSQAIVVQFVLQCINNRFLEVVLSIILFFSIDYSLFGNEEALKNENLSKQKAHVAANIKEAVPYIVIVILLSLILGVEDSIVVYKNAVGELSLFSFVRLFYALGLICAGFIANYKKGVYLTLFSICSMILSVVSIVFMSSNSSSYNISMSIMYFYSGFYVVFLTVNFMYISSRMAGFGRITRSIATAFIVFVTTAFGTAITYESCIILNCLFIIATIIISVFSGVLIPADLIKGSEDKLKEDDIYKKYFDKYNFTKREQDVFIKLVCTEDTVISIAADLNISRRVLQRHISSIYAKTGVQTRSGLIKSLYTL